MRYQLQLLGNFGLRYEQADVALPMTPQRLLAFLAINGPTLRSVLIGTLWPHLGETHARGSLRSAMWRLQRGAPYLLAPSGDVLGLGPDVLIDVRTVTASAQTVLRDSCHLPADRSLLFASDELLPGWHDDWVIIERERLRQLRLHALDALAERLTAQRRYIDAMEAALESARIEPLRESVNRVIIAIHLAEGNATKALRHYQFFRSQLGAELGIEPSAQMTAMLPSAVLQSLSSC
jgi:DNA-binding SARP family transcriptional activator